MLLQTPPMQWLGWAESFVVFFLVFSFFSVFFLVFFFFFFPVLFGLDFGFRFLGLEKLVWFILVLVLFGLVIFVWFS